jgi:hypothetical protein
MKTRNPESHPDEDAPDRCPVCRGDLDGDGECPDCGDATDWQQRADELRCASIDEL